MIENGTTQNHKISVWAKEYASIQGIFNVKRNAKMHEDK